MAPACSVKPPAFAAPASSFAKKAVVPCREASSEWTEMDQAPVYRPHHHAFYHCSKLQGAAPKLLLLLHHLFPLKLWSLAVESAVIGLTWTRHLPLAEARMHSIISLTFSKDSPAFAAPTSSPARKAVVRCNVNYCERSLFAGMLNLRKQAIMQTVHMACHLPDVKILYSLLTLAHIWAC